MSYYDKIVKKVLEKAQSLVGTKEVGQNGGVVIDEIQKVFGMKNQQYCVMFTLYCWDFILKQVLSERYDKPFPMVASSQTLFEWAKKNNFTYTDTNLIKPGDIVIWRKFNLWQGHAGLINSKVRAIDSSFEDFEGNTSNSDFGSQRDGDGIYKRKRFAKKLDFSVDNFYIRGFIDMEKVFNSKGFERLLEVRDSLMKVKDPNADLIALIDKLEIKKVELIR